MEARLIESLHHRLSNLEHKVQAYRHDLAADFHQYCNDLLGGVSPDVASNVKHAMITGLSNYPILRPELDFIQAESRGPVTSTTTTTSGLSATPSAAPSLIPTGDASAAFQPLQPPPPSAVFGAVDAAADSPADPHAREKEFQGLFTPSYLPLLDCAPVPPALPSPALSPATSLGVAAPPQAEPQLAGTGTGTGTGTGAGQGHDPAAMDAQRLFGEGHAPIPPFTQPQLPNRPAHVRHSNDDTNSSVYSDRSEHKVRRSALRRSSSPSKTPQSPRRVRFEFMGAEVLPTASPEVSHSLTSQPSSDKPEDDLLAPSPGFNDTDEWDNQPPPRKISSSEALRALSRTPLDESTVWTVVNPSAGQNISTDKIQASKEEHPLSPTDTSVVPLAAPTQTRPRQETTYTLQSTTLSTVPDLPENIDEQDESSDEEFLTMGKSKTPATKTAPPSDSINVTANEEPLFAPVNANDFPLESPPSKDERNLGSEEDDDDELFHFEAGGGGLTAPPKPRQAPAPVKDGPSEDEIDEVVEDGQTKTAQALYGTSPAVPITKPATALGSPSPTAAKFHVGSLGSYKGRPLIMPVVRDPEVHAQAASLGQFNTFVGGLDGRSGMDEGDLNSFRASMVQPSFSGTPRSLTERMMMEEAQLQRSRQDTLP
ncbi:hypothetical protein S40285_00230 [Stachybotrys chlorohalonatus IBT 40285]|uniref:Uncharacterized protein n=1 Tax=Stachybotrys chlorohalonatus (strain IBT 40285) TaxID=1283841 RepID=A0A084QTX5_STAC4|nr:hypothetical protein S40285_00230 [Stachybotrys chlorohalonata IBT 40285]